MTNTFPKSIEVVFALIYGYLPIALSLNTRCYSPYTSRMTVPTMTVAYMVANYMRKFEYELAMSTPLEGLIINSVNLKR